MLHMKFCMLLRKYFFMDKKQAEKHSFGSERIHPLPPSVSRGRHRDELPVLSGTMSVVSRPDVSQQEQVNHSFSSLMIVSFYFLN